MMKKIICLMGIMVILCSFLFSFAYAKEFSDVAETHWAHEYINELSDNGVINGYKDGTFKPSGTITNAEFLKLVIACCLPQGMDLSDAEGGVNHWASPYVLLAEIYGIADAGAYTEENLNEPITRIKMVRLVSRADMIMKGNAAKFDTELSFFDIGDLGTEITSLLRHAVGRELIKGYEDNTFRPEKTMTRAEAATMIWRLSK